MTIKVANATSSLKYLKLSTDLKMISLATLQTAQWGAERAEAETSWTGLKERKMKNSPVCNIYRDTQSKPLVAPYHRGACELHPQRESGFVKGPSLRASVLAHVWVTVTTKHWGAGARNCSCALQHWGILNSPQTVQLWFPQQAARY